MYRLQKCIGSGSFGSVFTVKKYNQGKTYVAKRVTTYKLKNKDKEQLINEIRILKYCNCPYILPFIDCVYNGTNIDIITEYAKYGDFSKIIKRNRKKIKENLIWSYFIQSCLGIQYLHKNNIIHRDIKSANILLGRNEQVYIADFGISKILLNNNQFTNTCIGTPFYMTPEMLNHEEYDNSVDIWGLGCFLFELITYRPPFGGYDIRSLTKNISSMKFNLNINMYDHIYSKGLLNFPKKLLINNSKDRMDMNKVIKSKEIAEHLYLIPYIVQKSVCISNIEEKFKPLTHVQWRFVIQMLKK